MISLMESGLSPHTAHEIIGYQKTKCLIHALLVLALPTSALHIVSELPPPDVLVWSACS